MTPLDYKKIVAEAYRQATLAPIGPAKAKEPDPQVVAAIVLAMAIREKMDWIGTTLEEINETLKTVKTETKKAGSVLRRHFPED